MGVFNNAGVDELFPFERLTRESYDYLFNTNVWGQIAVTKAFLPLLKQWDGNGWARIIFNSTMGLYIPIPCNGTYVASKSALEHLANIARLELKRHKIHVSVVEPGGFKSEIFGKQFSPLEKNFDDKEYGTIYKNMIYWLKLFDKYSQPVEVIGKDIYVSLFSYFPPTTTTSGFDCLVLACLNYILPDAIFNKINPTPHLIEMNKLF